MHTPQPSQDPLLPLALALLELLEQPILLNLEHPNQNESLNITGRLLRAFDPPNPTTMPSITVMTGANCTNIRLAKIQTARYQRTTKPPNLLIALELLLGDGYRLHLKKAPIKTPQPE